MADDRDSLLREVDEELRREQMQKLWDRYNGLILGGAALIVVAVGGYKFLESRRIAAITAAGAEFSQALQASEASKDDEALKAFEKIIKTGPTGYATLARLHVAGAHVKAGKTEDAVAAYQAVVNDASAEGLLKSFAQLQIATLKVGDGDFTAQKNRLTVLASDDSAFKVTARELLGLSAFKAGKLDEARSYFEPLLIDPKASRAIQERVKIVMAEIARSEVGKGATAKPAETKTDAPK
jgi:hypothetical protein